MAIVSRLGRPSTSPLAAEDLRIGAIVRASRRQAGLGQEDVARVAGVSRQSVSLVECGHALRLGVRVVRTVGAAVGLDLAFAVRSRGAWSDRLIDEEHSALVEAVVRRLEADGWLVVVEFSFNEFGDRGSVDVLAWRADLAALLIVEVKSVLADLQAMCRSNDMKRRVVPRVLARDRNWRPRVIGSAIVLPDTTGQRRAVARREAMFAAAFPARTVEVRRWIHEPSSPDLWGIWFLDSANAIGTKRRPPAESRVRRAQAARPNRTQA